MAKVGSLVGGDDNSLTNPLYGDVVLWDPSANGGVGGFVREECNKDLTFMASALRTATNDTGPLNNYSHRGVVVYIDITAASGTGGITVKVEGLDPASGKWFTVQQDTNRTAIGSYSFQVYPAGTGSLVLPRTYRVRAAHGDASNYTYSVGGSLVL